ncbi:hypothetical protein LTR10_014339 [Elasticomyces elasticus]|uniref:Uncharacterized protein n=1 Tax=Exophiala sideris TaxID=1016849 RepID=A0ABR0JJ30_9EURO|nr:hypothetical protein LTR10_014339 [Elasticomyces elasticus]KAK5034381.1 hypothetical protein LTS07_003302 [Exophiala sideris]KAK5042678.1 hypothetical protein LTR13_001526 [Exophiala sideris]KAK5065760.1 hypothetical protein LTR69_003310 [Exophiala sideris]KAK5185780.1 hypothetical protein LTR44_001829 [Eurotiomycetes sp. CCFEE 6388]
MAEAMDAHSSFVYLLDNLPVWKTTITSLSAYAAQKNSEFVNEYSQLVNQIRPKRQKSASLTSIHTNDEDVPSLPNRVEINPLEAGNRYLYAQATKKRKPGTSVRSGASGPQKFRNKNQVIVYYDASLQEQLDSMVKLIGVGRNNLRKGKKVVDRPQTPVPDDESSFLLVDRELESIQSLCEIAAHQFLRDGDCSTELNSILQKLDAVLVQSTKTAESLKKFTDQQNETAQEETDSDVCTLVSDTTQSDTTLSSQSFLNRGPYIRSGLCKDSGPTLLNRTLEDMKAHELSLSAPEISDNNAPGLLSDNIEVDDASDQSSIVVDITQYRLANPRRTRV